jgi:hypothetical protein
MNDDVHDNGASEYFIEDRRFSLSSSSSRDDFFLLHQVLHDNKYAHLTHRHYHYKKNIDI